MTHKCISRRIWLSASLLLCSMASYANDANTLRALAAKSFPKGNVDIGVAAHGRSVETDVVLARIVEREFGSITPANDFKQSFVHPRPNAPWDWGAADRWIERARQHKQLLRIHAPIGPQVSAWVKGDDRTAAELSAMMDMWLPALCARYAKDPAVRWIDVVNETVDWKGNWLGPKGGAGWADNPWLTLGFTAPAGTEVPSYVVRAFELANRHCGGLKLIINQQVIEPPAVVRLKQLVAAVRANGLRVDGIGWQGHVDIGWEKLPGRLRWLTELVDWAHANQLEFHITENNVYMPRGVTVLDEAAQADTFAAILRVLLERRERGDVRWTLWHARDDQTDNKRRLGCLWNNDNQPKAAYFAVRKLLSDPPAPLPMRGGVTR